MTLHQADKRWSTIKLGDGGETIGTAGCVLTCLTEAARLLSGRVSLLPPHANEILRQGGAFVAGTSSLIVHRAARLLGMESPSEEKVTLLQADPLDVVCAAILETGSMAIVQVSNQNGTKTSTHYLLATHSTPAEIHALDPALARAVPLDRPSMRAVVMWRKDPHTYRAVSVRPLRPGPTLIQ